MKCPECGYENKPGATRCGRCEESIGFETVSRGMRFTDRLMTGMAFLFSKVFLIVLLAAAGYGVYLFHSKAPGIMRAVRSFAAPAGETDEKVFENEVLNRKGGAVLVSFDVYADAGEMDRWAEESGCLLKGRALVLNSAGRYGAYTKVPEALFLKGKQVASLGGLTPDRKVNEALRFLVYRPFLYPRLKTSRPGAGVAHVSGRGFDKAFRSKRPVIVNFTSSRSPACGELIPSFSRTAREYGAVADFYLNELDAESGARFDVQEAPTIVCFVNGIESGRVTGGCENLAVAEARVLQLIYPDLIARAKESLEPAMRRNGRYEGSGGRVKGALRTAVRRVEATVAGER